MAVLTSDTIFTMLNKVEELELASLIDNDYSAGYYQGRKDALINIIEQCGLVHSVQLQNNKGGYSDMIDKWSADNISNASSGGAVKGKERG